MVEVRWYSKRCPNAPKLQFSCQKRVLIVAGGYARLLFVTGVYEGFENASNVAKLQIKVEKWVKKSKILRRRVENG